MPTDTKQSAGVGTQPGTYGLAAHGLHNINAIYSDLAAPQLVEQALQRREGTLAANGALVVRTGQFTGRSPKDKFIVRDELTDPTVQWGPVNQPMSPAHFEKLYTRMGSFWQGQDVYAQNLLVGADPEYA